MSKLPIAFSAASRFYPKTISEIIAKHAMSKKQLIINDIDKGFNSDERRYFLENGEYHIFLTRSSTTPKTSAR